jgi:integrase
VTLRETAAAWLEGAKAQPPTVLNRQRLPYKPSALRGYEADLNKYVLRDLGAHRLSEITRGDLQALVDRLIGKGLSASKISNIIDTVRVIYRHEIARERVSVNPTTMLELPRGDNPRDRAASATEAAALLAALPKEDRALWATAFYGGLRRGELQALRWDDVDLAAGVIHVRHSWDEVAGEIAPKSRKGTRKTPIFSLLRDYLVEHKAATGREGRDFVFGSTRDRPFSPKTPHRRATEAWKIENAKRAKKKLDPLVPILLHECRHTCVSLMHDAGLSLEKIGDYVGHSSAYMTERYRHLLEGHEAEAVRLMDEYLARADTAARISQIETSRRTHDSKGGHEEEATHD